MAVGLPSVILSRFFLNAAFNGTITFVPLMLTQERGSTGVARRDPPGCRVAGVVGGSSTRGADLGRRWVLVSAGGALVAAGALVMVLLTALELSVWFFAPAMVFAGLDGLGSTSLSVILPTSSRSRSTVRPPRRFGLSDVLGSVIGIAVASALFATLHTPGGDRHTYIAIWTSAPPWPHSSSWRSPLPARASANEHVTAR